MKAIKRAFYLAIVLLIVSCGQPEQTRSKGFTPKYPDMPVLEDPIGAFAGVYEGKAGMRMDESRPLNDYPGEFTVTSAGTDRVLLTASIKPGKMPFPVNYTLQEATPLTHSREGYLLRGSFKVDVTLRDGSKKDMPEFYFTLNNRSRFFVDNDGQYWLELYYPDQKMVNGTVLPGASFFKGKKKQ